MESPNKMIEWALEHIDEQDLTLKVEWEFDLTMAQAEKIVDWADEIHQELLKEAK